MAGYGILEQLGIFNNTFNGQQLIYYTILSNLIIFIAYVFLNFKTLKNTLSSSLLDNVNFKADLRGSLTLMIVTTGIIYHVLLSPYVADLSQYGQYAFSNFLVHTYVPIAVFIDWIFGEEIQDLSSLHPMRWLVVPLGYWGLSILYASFKIPILRTGHYYAYFFIDSNRLGWGQTLWNVFFLMCFFILLSYFLKWCKKLNQDKIKHRTYKSKR